MSCPPPGQSQNGFSNEASCKKREDYLEWPEYFMAVAFLSAQRSKDPSSQVGACIVNSENKIVGIGYNGMPNGCSDDVLPWTRTAANRLDTKYPYGTKETGLPQASSHACCLLGMEMELSCLVPCNSRYWEETFVRADKRPYSSCASLSPPSSFCTHSSSCCISVGEADAAEDMGTGKTGIRNSFTLCCSSAVLGSGMAGGKIKKQSKSLEKFFLLPAWVGGRKHQSSQRNTGSFPVYSIYPCLLILFLTCNFNNWSDDREIKLA